MALTMASGVLTSRRALQTIGIVLENRDYFWTHLHGTFAYMTAIFGAVHVCMHRRWIFARLSRRHSADTSTESEKGIAFAILARRASLVFLVSLATAFAVLQLGRTSWAERVREGHRRHLQEHPMASPKLK